MGKQKLFLWQRLPLPHPCGRSVWTVTAPHGGWGTPPHSLQPPCPSLLVGSTVISATGQGPCVETAPASADPAPVPSPQPVLSPVITPWTPFPTEALGPRGGRCGLERLVSLGCGDPPLKRALTPGAALWGGCALSPHGEHSAAGSQTPLGSPHGGPRQPGVLPAEQLRSPHWDSKQIDWLFELLSHKTAPQTAPRWREAHATGRRGSGSERGASPSPPPGVPAPAGAATEGPAVHPAPSSSPHLTAFPSPSTALLPGARPPLTRLLFPSPSSISPTHRSCQVSLQTVFTRGLKSQIVLVCRFVSSGSPLDAQP